MTTDITELALITKIKKQLKNFDTVVLREAEANALVETLEKAQKSKEFLKGQLSELANFNPDWDKLEASYESWREIAAELLVAKDSIAELESRTVTVKLPPAIAVEDWMVDIDVYEADLVRALLKAAGIKWEAE